MSKQEPRTYWNWAITGLGGLLNMMEGVADEGCKPGGYQIAKFENLVIRANALYERFTGRGVRTLEQSNAERNFGSREVFDNYNDAQYQDRRSNQAERK